MSSKSPREHRDEYRDLGYTLFEGVLGRAEVEAAIPIFDELITPETRPPKVTGAADGRRQLNSGQFCEPRLSVYGAHPAVLDTVAALMDRPFRLWRAPVPTVTFTGKAGGLPGEDWRGHVDWDGTGQVNVSFLYGMIYFTDVLPQGGGFTVVPGGHRVIATNLANPDLLPRMLKQDFAGFPGLGPGKEITGPAGSVLYYHPLMVHGASDNTRPQARKVLHTHYFPVLHEAYERQERETIGQRFLEPDLAALDGRQRRLIGLAG